MTAPFPLIKIGTRAFLLVVLVLLVGMALPRAAHAQALPYPIDPNMAVSGWYCNNGAARDPGETYCTSDELNNTQIVGEFTITDIYGNQALAYVLGNGTVGYGNSSLTTYPGEPLTLSWSLDPYMIVRGWSCTSHGPFGICLNYGSTSYPRYYFDNGITSNFGQTSQYGTTVVIGPSSGSTSYNVGDNVFGRLSLSVNPSGSSPPAPVIRVTADSTSITTGQSTVVRATFSPGTGDTLTQTALNEISPGVMTGEFTIPGYGFSPVPSYNYTFTPTAAGSYTFKPYVTSNRFPLWNTEGQSVTVTVTPATPMCTLSSVSSGTSSTLTYFSQNAASFTVSPTVGALTPNTTGTQSVSPTNTTTYTGTVQATSTSYGALKQVFLTSAISPFAVVNKTWATVGPYPYALARDSSGNLYVANYGSGTVSKVNQSGAVVATYAVGTYPIALAVDTSNNLYVANYTAGTVSKVNTSGTTVATYTVDAYPYALAFDSSGNLYVANYYNGTISKISNLNPTQTTWTAPPGVTSVKYLVVAGGGGGGSSMGGGGGAGGVLSGTMAVTPGNQYTVIVGNGGAASSNGGNSVFGTITTIGGGAGGYYSGVAPSSGGSGGGGGSYGTAGASGTSGQGNTGGASSSSWYVGGGGGGAGAVGAAGGTTNGGNGGIGLQSSISGTATYYAGGGGGGGEYWYTYCASGGSGGAGGGGAGSCTGNGTAGTANTGGGGGGGDYSYTGGAGGSGVVILSYVDTSGATQVVPFTSSANLNPVVNNSWATVGTDPISLTFDSSGNLYVADYGSYAVSKVNTSGTVVATYTVGPYPYDLAFDPSSNSLYVADYASYAVSKINTATGAVNNSWAAVGPYPTALTLDTLGNVYVANWNQSTVSKINPSGTITDTYNTGSNSYAIAFDPSSNSVYTADYGSYAVSKISNLNVNTTSTWTVPSDWNSAGNTIEVIGGGGGGLSATNGTNVGVGGGGGAYAKNSNVTLTPGSTLYYSVGVGGTPNVAGVNTWFNTTGSNAAPTSASQGVLADGGNSGTLSSTGGQGGQASASYGGVTTSGGNGGNGSSADGSGGGGAAGPSGAGAIGGGPAASTGAGGGGGASGGAAGATASSLHGGVGGNGPLGTGGGTAGGGAGSNGGGGGGGTYGGTVAGGNGGAGTDWSSSYGAGGGGGGGSWGNGVGNGGTGGLYGGGGGGGSSNGSTNGAGGVGGQGVVVISYISLSTQPQTASCTTIVSTDNSCTFNGLPISSGNTVTASLSPVSPCTSQTFTCNNGVFSPSTPYSCTAAGAISSFTATPSRVHPGGTTTLAWSTSNMASCTVTSSDTPVQTLSTALSSTGLIIPNITHPEIYTLSCTDNNSASFTSQVQVKLVPVVQEL